MQGVNLKKAQEWFDRAVQKEESASYDMNAKCLDKALKYEQLGIEAGESW